MKRYICVDEFLKMAKWYLTKEKIFTVKTCIEKLPENNNITEVVRCSKCKYRSEEPTYGYYRCKKRDFEVSDDFYCKDGEER